MKQKTLEDQLQAFSCPGLGVDFDINNNLMEMSPMPLTTLLKGGPQLTSVLFTKYQVEPRPNLLTWFMSNWIWEIKSLK